MPYADNNGARIFWEERGEGSPLLLVMGHSYSSAMWYPVVDQLAAEHRVITFDNRGTGKSSPMRKITVGDMARDAFAVLDSAGEQSAHIYGVSMGGGIILEMARQHPERVRSLLLGCTMAKTPDTPGIPLLLRPVIHLPASILVPLLRRIQKADVPNPYGSAAPADKVARDIAMVEATKATDLTSAAQSRAIGKYTIAEADVRALTMPALVLHGDEDHRVAYSAGVRLHELIAHSELLTLHGAGHNYFIARGAEANAKALSFLADVDAQSDQAA